MVTHRTHATIDIDGLALFYELERPWPLVAPGGPRLDHWFGLVSRLAGNGPMGCRECRE